jgi:uncharacterized protein (TIGR00290 family)
MEKPDSHTTRGYALRSLSNARDSTRTIVLMSWSGGKDSCIALYDIQRERKYRVAALVTTVTRDYDRISMHGVRRVLLERQAASLGLQLHQVLISKGATNEEYEMKMGEVLSLYRDRGIDSIVFGDLFLEDIRAYREQFLARHRMHGLFPVWHRNTSVFIRQFLELGFRAVVTCVDSNVLDQSFAGKLIDESFLSSLPAQVDPCGENGEFHSFVFDGPIFAAPVRFSLGETVLRESFWFRDLVPE